MQYVSTRGSAPALDFEGVTLAGLASRAGWSGLDDFRLLIFYDPPKF